MAATAAALAFSVLVGTAFDKDGNQLFYHNLAKFRDVAACRMALLNPAVELEIYEKVQNTAEVHRYELRCSYVPGEADLVIDKEL